MEPVKIKISDWQKARLVARKAEADNAKRLFDEIIATIVCGVVNPAGEQFDVEWKDNELTLVPRDS